MKTVFRDCFLANFSVDPDCLRRVLPRPIEPDLYNGRAYLSIVIANMRDMRPAFLPRMFGISYHQVVYRAVVRCRGELGVYFVRSDANNKIMCAAGDRLTAFRFHYAEIDGRRDGDLYHFDLRASDVPHAEIHATYDLGHPLPEMPHGSAFASIDEAKEHLVELFGAFSINRETGQVDVVRIRRGEWDLKVVNDLRADYRFMQLQDPFTPETAHLDSVFYVEEIPYYWLRLNDGGA